MSAIKMDFKTKKLEVRLLKKFDRIINNKKMLKEIGEFVVNRIVTQARKGKPMRKTRLGRFPKQAEATPKMKRELAKANPGLTHAAFRKSGRGRNITQSGQLLDGLKYKILRGKVRLFITGGRKLFRDSRGRILEQERTNAAVYRELLKLNSRYNIMAVDPKGYQRIFNMVRKQVRKSLRA